MTPATRLYLAWLVSIVATAGSLYFSEVRGFAPCILCWFQRTMMYPLVLVLGVAAYRADWSARAYALPLALVGWLVALYHNLENWGVVPGLKACSVNPAEGCGVPWPIFGPGLTNVSNVITIPVLSLVAFTLVLALLLWPARDARRYAL